MVDPPSCRLAPKELPGILERIQRGGPALVALSGGVDSSLVASYAREALGDDVLAVTLVGPAIAAVEVHRAERIAKEIGIAHRLRSVDPLTIDAYRQNPPDRCFFCRSAETEVLLTEARRAHRTQWLDGVHVGDLGDERPGLAAMDRAGFRHPLLEAGFTKADVRRAARERGLSNWDEPSNACLASRVRHGIPITDELLRRVEQGEALLHAAGFRQVRLRVEDGRARIEVGTEEVSRLQAQPRASGLLAALRELGFLTVEVDPRGYRAASPASGPRS